MSWGKRIKSYLIQRKLQQNNCGADTIERFVELFLGLALLPAMFGFIYVVINDNNTAGIAGANIIVPLIGVFISLSLVYDSVRNIRQGK